MAGTYPNVYGGSAQVANTTPVRVINVRESRPFASSLDIEVQGEPVDILVTSGAGQTSVTRVYSCQTGRLIMPVYGDDVTVDVALSPLATPGNTAAVRALLGLGASTNAPVPLSVGHSQFTALGIGATAFAGTQAAARAVYNGTGANLDVQIDGATLYTVLPLQTLRLDYVGPFVINTAVGGPVTVTDFLI